MRFAAISMFWLLWGIPVLALFYLLVFRWKKRTLERFGNLEILSRMMFAASPARQYIKAVLILCACFFLVLALARPQWGTKMELISRSGVDIVIAMDVSNSMLAEDIKPNRLERSKYEVGQMISRLAGDRVGLVAFSGEAFMQCPLTLDYGAAKMFLDILDPDLIPVPGTAIAKAVEVSRKAFESKDRKYKVLILITDGEDHEGQLVEEAEKSAAEGVVIYTLGIGSESGVPIPERDAGGNVRYKKDREGNVVMTRLDGVMLSRVAMLTNGKFYQSSTGSLELERIYGEIRKMEKREMDSKHFTQFEDRYQWPLGVAIGLLVLEFFLGDRRKKNGIWYGRFSSQEKVE